MREQDLLPILHQVGRWASDRAIYEIILWEPPKLSFPLDLNYLNIMKVYSLPSWSHLFQISFKSHHLLPSLQYECCYYPVFAFLSYLCFFDTHTHVHVYTLTYISINNITYFDV